MSSHSKQAVGPTRVCRACEGPQAPQAVPLSFGGKCYPQDQTCLCELAMIWAFSLPRLPGRSKTQVPKAESITPETLVLAACIPLSLTLEDPRGSVHAVSLLTFPLH